jgi:putative colanic acid biosynthesis acetyltransferase WcaF
MTVILKDYNNKDYSTGAGFSKRVLWYAINSLFFDSFLFPISSLKSKILRLFKAEVGNNVVLKPRINIKYPWYLHVRDNVWIGEGVWIDNLTHVQIGSNVCISQGAYLCTGNHDYKDINFRLFVKEITIKDGAWIGAKTLICPGVTIGKNAVITAGSVINKSAVENGIYSGNPAIFVRKREFHELNL